MKRIIYIAGPYTSHATGYRTQLLEQTCRAAVVSRYAAIIKHKLGVEVFSPITHGHAIWMAGGCELDHTARGWETVNRAMMDASTALHVLRLRGWEHSTGLRAEIDYFAERGIAPQWVDVPVEFYKHARERLACHPLESAA